ncbi:MAG: discoidin domain-containing protein [Verrucomicrobiales bacterium]|nr:discoidin domain-containing protein [Verrucomicrobiales bacterium]
METIRRLIGLGSLGLVLGGWPGDAFGGDAAVRNRYVPHPEVAPLTHGIAWPRGQALPRFATPAPALDAIEVQALSRDEQITFSALQGQVNRERPRILLLDARSDEGRDTWPETATVGLTVGHRYDHETRYDLVAKFAGEVAGLVVYDPDLSPHHRNLAGTVAGLRQALPVTTGVRGELEAHGIHLEVVEDLTELEGTSPLEVYRHLYETVWPLCEKRLIVSARPENRGGDFHHTRDIAAACGAAVVWLDNRIPEERALMRRFLGDMTAGEGVVLGWYSTERSGITTASEFGIGTLPADHFISGSVYSGTDPRILIPLVPRMPALTNQVYVAIFISDGDNIQYTQRALRRIWDRASPSRGRVPLNWTIAPGLVDIAPGILNYYYTTATTNDCFVNGPSGMGYLMPFNTLEEPGAPVGNPLEDPRRMAGYARLTETYLQRAGLRGVTIWDQALPMHRAAYAEHCRTLYGATVQNFRDVPSVAGSVEAGHLWFDRLVVPYVGTYEHIRRSLTGQIEQWDGCSPLFLAYQVSIWGEMKPDRIVGLQEELTRRFPGQVTFVRADHYFNLHNQAEGLPFNLALLPGVEVRGGDSRTRPELAIDGTPNTFWQSSSPDSNMVELAFGGRYRLHRCLVRHAGAAGLSPTLNPRAFTVQVRLQDGAWRTIGEFRGDPVDVTDFDLTPVTADQLRLSVEEPGLDGLARVAELEVYGSR